VIEEFVTTEGTIRLGNLKQLRILCELCGLRGAILAK
jgi:hypothetical protein